MGSTPTYVFDSLLVHECGCPITGVLMAFSRGPILHMPLHNKLQ